MSEFDPPARLRQEAGSGGPNVSWRLSGAPFPSVLPQSGGEFPDPRAEGDYNGVPSHRVIYDFMIRGGVPVPDEAAAVYRPVGGAPWPDLSHTVFGQVYEGMDTVDRIASAAADNNDRPLTEIQILGINKGWYQIGTNRLKSGLFPPFPRPLGSKYVSMSSPTERDLAKKSLDFRCASSFERAKLFADKAKKRRNTDVFQVFLHSIRAILPFKTDFVPIWRQPNFYMEG